MLPPGDIRNCMVALSEDSLLLSKLFRHRFAGNGELGGHSFGNIFLAALTETDRVTLPKRSDYRRRSSRAKGHIYPATTANVHLAAELVRRVGGSMVKLKISRVGPKIKRIISRTRATCQPMPEAISRHRKCRSHYDRARIVIHKPFTAAAWFDGVAEAIAQFACDTRFLSGNLMTQPGETRRFFDTETP